MTASPVKWRSYVMAARNLLPGQLPVGFVDQPAGIDPRGVCGTCRFYVDDAREVEAEFKFIAGTLGVGLQTSERAVDAAGQQRFGELVLPTRTAYANMDAAILHRMRMDPSQFGLCEKGMARIVGRQCGTEADQEGRRINQCPLWKPYSRLETLIGRRVRHKRWKERREQALALRARPTFFFQACPWHPGRDFKDCCGRRA